MSRRERETKSSPNMVGGFCTTFWIQLEHGIVKLYFGDTNNQGTVTYDCAVVLSHGTMQDLCTKYAQFLAQTQPKPEISDDKPQS